MIEDSDHLMYLRQDLEVTGMSLGEIDEELNRTIYKTALEDIYDEMKMIVDNDEFGCFLYSDTEKLRSLVNTLGDMIA